ncbi:MAG: signal peptidase I [Firmicutes bacterium]|nr:signal peptidase I [Bacillota bacterium]
MPRKIKSLEDINREFFSSYAAGTPAGDADARLPSTEATAGEIDAQSGGSDHFSPVPAQSPESRPAGERAIRTVYIRKRVIAGKLPAGRCAAAGPSAGFKLILIREAVPVPASTHEPAAPHSLEITAGQKALPGPAPTLALPAPRGALCIRRRRTDKAFQRLALPAPRENPSMLSLPVEPAKKLVFYNATPTAPEPPAAAPSAPTAEAAAGPEPRGKKRPVFRMISNLVFYLAIAGILFTSVVYSSGNKGVLNVLGYSFLDVVSGSMQREIPKGSLVIIRAFDPERLIVGDDITYMRQDNSTVTHRIIQIIEDYQGGGERGFVTKGLENADPDENVVRASAVVGKVAWHVPGLGFTLTYIAGHIALVLVIFGSAILFSVGLGALLRDRRDERRKRNETRAGSGTVILNR